jgi:hypothetical protein
VKWWPRRPTARLAGIAGALILAAAGYVALLEYFSLTNAPMQREFGATGAEQPLVQIHMQPMSIDALNATVLMHVSLTPSAALRGELSSAPDRDLFLVVAHGNSAQEIRIAANEPAPIASFEIDLHDGSVADYPLDSYRSELRVQCFERALPPRPNARALPLQVIFWEAVLGFQVQAAELPGNGPHEVRLSLDVHRSGGFSLFALAAYGAMAVLGCCSLAIGVLAFIGLRRPDAPFVGALGAIVFALPALRSTLPGAPPLGVRADMLIFLWTEIAAVIAVVLFVSTWAQKGPPP